MAEKAEVLLIGLPKRVVVDGLKEQFTVHVLPRDEQAEAMLANVGPRVRAAAVTGAPEGRMNGATMARCPRLEVVSSFGVGYDNIDVKYAGEHGIVVCNTPEVLTEEVADLGMGLLLATARQMVKGDRYVRTGEWVKRGTSNEVAILDRMVEEGHAVLTYRGPAGTREYRITSAPPDDCPAQIGRAHV